MALALSLPTELPVRGVIIAMTFGVVVLSVVVQGSTMGFVLKYLGFVRVRTKAAALLGKNLARLRIIQAQLKEIENLPAPELPYARAIANRLMEEKNAVILELEDRQHDEEFQQATRERVEEIETHLSQVARGALRTCSESNLITEKEAHEIGAESRGQVVSH